MIARIWGDEFLIVAPCQDRNEILQCSERFHSLFNEPFEMKGYEFHITASAGIATYPDDGSTPEELLFKADTAMSHAKKVERINSFFIEKTWIRMHMRKFCLKHLFEKRWIRTN